MPQAPAAAERERSCRAAGGDEAAAAGGQPRGAMTAEKAYDYIIIGSGSAGSTLAGRLSEDGASSVLLLEAGPRDNSIYIRMPAALGVPLTSRRFNWYYHSEPDPHIGERRIYEARGRVLGGSSS